MTTDRVTVPVVRAPVPWSDEVQSVLAGDLTAAAAYLTPAGGAVVCPVAPCGYVVRERGVLGFTTSLGLPRKLERIVAEPRVALAFHAREHGFATAPLLVLVQGVAEVDLAPSRARLEAFVPLAERFLGRIRRGPVWDRLLREYYAERVFVDVSVSRVVAWPDLRGVGAPRVFGAEPVPRPGPQPPPARGTGPRVPVRRFARGCHRLPHQLVAYRGSDGYPVVVPVRITGTSPAGLHLAAPAGLLPPGGRRAGLLAHRYRPRLVGFVCRFGTGWLEVGDDGEAVYAPHTSTGLVAPPVKALLLVSNGLIAKYGMWRARRTGVADRLARLAADRPTGGSTG